MHSKTQRSLLQYRFQRSTRTSTNHKAKALGSFPLQNRKISLKEQNNKKQFNLPWSPKHQRLNDALPKTKSWDTWTTMKMSLTILTWVLTKRCFEMIFVQTNTAWLRTGGRSQNRLRGGLYE